MFRHNGITLRALEKSDLEPLRALRNDPSTWTHLTDPHMLTAEAQNHWFLSLAAKTDRMYFTICNDAHPFIGVVRMDEYDRLHRSVRVGADVATELRGRGFGHMTFEAIKAYCFQVLNLHRIWLAVLETNSRAMRLYEKHGFQMEGRYRQAIFRGGRYHDYILMSLLENEYVPDPSFDGQPAHN